MTEKSRRKLDDRSAVPRTERVHREKVSEEQDENATGRSRCKQTTKRVSRRVGTKAWRSIPRAPAQETHRHIEARGPSCLNRFGSTALSRTTHALLGTAQWLGPPSLRVPLVEGEVAALGLLWRAQAGASVAPVGPAAAGSSAAQLLGRLIKKIYRGMWS